ncbi:SIR2 family protein [Cellulomonas edaphi]|uniref:SIR2 family protein n=1 Tax=Cellulomonas edaphi TaxID=3053468 RepID=A0ABT7S7P8_9CELL|nr:SIR2 family protein [Cellulomons edaphi]MDM7831648.1 SIR2 family protein [Cellulomons edaphi]
MATEVGDDDSWGMFVVGGVIKSCLRTSDRQLVIDHLSSVLQVHNLVILVGSGASFHLGSPKSRELTTSALQQLIETSGATLTSTDLEVLRALNPGESGDLERLLDGLQAATALAAHTGQTEVSLGGLVSFSVEELEQLRAKIGTAFANACRLPGDPDRISEGFRDDPLRAHRTFLSRIVGSRRANLPRPRFFTTNYDLVIERALDQIGTPYIDGFSGTVERRLNLAYYGLDYHRVGTTSQQVLARADSALYLHKIHGSLNWRATNARDAVTGVESLEVRQVTDETPEDADRVLIYPTTAKEGDTLAYPYSDLMRLLGDAVQQDDTAVISIGYGFADPHINRILLRSLALNPALNILVVDPRAVIDDERAEALPEPQDLVGKQLRDAGVATKSTAISALALAADSRIAVLTGPVGTFTNFAELLPDPAASSGMTRPSVITDLIQSLEAVIKPTSPVTPSVEAR